jgi:hypothetical protein
MLASQHERAVLHKAAHQLITVWTQYKAAFGENSTDKQRHTLGRGAPYQLVVRTKQPQMSEPCKQCGPLLYKCSHHNSTPRRDSPFKTISTPRQGPTQHLPSPIAQHVHK